MAEIEETPNIGEVLGKRLRRVGIDTRETAEDVARTLACYHSVIAARVMDHDHLVRMSDAVSIPVLNLLSDKEHPLQALQRIQLLEVELQLFGREHQPGLHQVPGDAGEGGGEQDGQQQRRRGRVGRAIRILALELHKRS